MSLIVALSAAALNSALVKLNIPLLSSLSVSFSPSMLYVLTPHIPTLHQNSQARSHKHSSSPCSPRQWRCTSSALSGPISLCSSHCTAHQGLQRRLVQLQAVSELQWEPGTQHAGEQPAVHCSKLARGDFNGVSTKYEHEAERAAKQKQRYFGMRMFSSEIFLIPSGFRVM